MHDPDFLGSEAVAKVLETDIDARYRFQVGKLYFTLYGRAGVVETLRDEFDQLPGGAKHRGAGLLQLLDLALEALWVFVRTDHHDRDLDARAVRLTLRRTFDGFTNRR